VSRAIVTESVTYLDCEAVPILGMLTLVKTEYVFGESTSCGTTTDNLALKPVLGGHLKTGHMWSVQNRP
jgi:hypothetical protein